VQERKIFFFNIHYTKDFIQKELIFLPLGILFQSSDHPDFLLTIALSSETIYMFSLWNKRRSSWLDTNPTFPLRRNMAMCIQYIYRETTCVLWWRAESRKCQIYEQYTPHFLFLSIFFFIARRRSKRFPDMYATIFAGFALFFHILIRVSSSCERWTGCYV